MISGLLIAVLVSAFVFEFINGFLARMLNATRCPVAREMPANMKDKLDNYLCRKRPN